MRAIVRFSVDNENTGALRNKLNQTLVGHGFVLNPHVTATYEHDQISEQDLAVTMQEFWQETQNATNNAQLDHF